MTGRAPGRLTRLVALVALVPLTVACTLVPDNGPVRHHAQVGIATSPEPAYVDPPGPLPGAAPGEIAAGFLAAMQANPINTASARTYLSVRARQSWKPDRGTVVYDASTIQSEPHDVVRVRFSDAHRLDSRGQWLQGPTRARTVRFQLVREKGQWRIDNPPSALIVRASYFQNQFEPLDLYFFDHTGRVLVPEPVYIPRGQQAATSLVRGLLEGPPTRLSAVLRTALPASASLDFSVAVTDSGVAEVPLGQEVLKLTPEELDRAMIQLAWTLRPVTGIQRVRITVDGTPVALPDGRTDISVDEGSEFAPTGLGASRELVGIRDGRVVTVSPSAAQPVAGGLGRRGFALRSVALDRSGATVAAVSQDGTTAYVAPTEKGSHKVHRVFDSGHDLLRPAFDLFGNLWLVDRTSSGAVVHVVHDGVDHVVAFPGISGHPVSSFAVSPDGSRLAVGLADEAGRRVDVATVQRGGGGGVEKGMQPVVLPVSSYDPAHAVGPVVDVGWRTPTVLAILTHPSAKSSRVVYAMADGSPGNGQPVPPDPFPEGAEALVVNADSGLSLLLLGEHGRLSRVDAAGKWETTGPPGLTAAAYAN